MKDIKPFQMIILAVFALSALLGLYFFANFNGGGGTAKIGEVTIWGTLPKEGVEAAIQELTATNDEYADVTYAEVSAGSFSRQLADALAEGRGPDLVLISQEELLSERGKLKVIPYATLPARTFTDSFVSEFELFLTDEGSYGVPVALDPLMLYYNRSMLSSAAITGAPRTWEAVSGLTSVIVKRDTAGALTRSLIPFGSYGNVTNARAILSLLFLQAGTPITAESEVGVRSALGSESSFGRPVAESAATYYAEFGDPAKLVYSWSQAKPSSRSVFLSGDLALYPGFASELPGLQEAAPNLDFDMAPIPQPGTGGARMTYGKAYAFAVTRASDNAESAYTVATALSDGKPASALVGTLSMAPARKQLLLAAPSDRFASLYYPEALIAKGWLSPSPASVDSIFSAMIGNMTTGRQDAAEALEAAAGALDAALR